MNAAGRPLYTYVLCGLLLGCSRGPEQSSVRSDRFSLSFRGGVHQNLGSVFIDEEITHIFAFQNDADQVVSIDDVRLSCGCLSVDVPKPSIAPGEEGQIVLSAKLSLRDSERVLLATVYTSLGEAIRLSLQAVVEARSYPPAAVPGIVLRSYEPGERFPRKLAGKLRIVWANAPHEDLVTVRLAPIGPEITSVTCVPVRPNWKLSQGEYLAPPNGSVFEALVEYEVEYASDSSELAATRAGKIEMVLESKGSVWRQPVRFLCRRIAGAPLDDGDSE